jgi:hypothetical protein
MHTFERIPTHLKPGASTVQGLLKLAELQAGHADAAAATRSELAAAAAHAPLPTTAMLPHAANSLATATIAAAACCLARCLLLRDKLAASAPAGGGGSDISSASGHSGPGGGSAADYAAELASAASKATQGLRAKVDAFAAQAQHLALAAVTAAASPFEAAAALAVDCIEWLQAATGLEALLGVLVLRQREGAPKGARLRAGVGRAGPWRARAPVAVLVGWGIRLRQAGAARCVLARFAQLFGLSYLRGWADPEPAGHAAGTSAEAPASGPADAQTSKTALPAAGGAAAAKGKAKGAPKFAVGKGTAILWRFVETAAASALCLAASGWHS